MDITPILLKRIKALEERVERLAHLQNIEVGTPLFKSESVAGDVGGLFIGMDAPTAADSEPVPIIAYTAAPVVLPAVDATVAVSITSVVDTTIWMVVGQTILMTDGTHVWYGTITSITDDLDFVFELNYDDSVVPTAWSATTMYEAGVEVLKSGTVYTCIVGNYDTTPPNALYWTAERLLLTGAEVIISGNPFTSGTTPTFTTSPATGTATGPAFVMELASGSGFAWTAATNILTLTYPSSLSTTTFTTSPTTSTATGPAFILMMGVAGTDLNWSAGSATLTLNVPDASTTARGVVNLIDQTFLGIKYSQGQGNAGGAFVANGDSSTNGFNPYDAAWLQGQGDYFFGPSIQLVRSAPGPTTWPTADDGQPINYAGIADYEPNTSTPSGEYDGYWTFYEGANGLTTGLQILGASGGTLPITAAFVLPAVGATVNVFLTGTAGMQVNDQIQFADLSASPVKAFKGHITSVVDGLTITVQTDIIYLGNSGDTYSTSATFKAWRYARGVGGTDSIGNIFYGGLCINVGSGNPYTVSDGFTAQTTPITVVTFTVPNDGKAHIYETGGMIKTTALSTDVLQIEVTYTDEGGASQTRLLCYSTGTGVSSSVSATGTYNFLSATVTALSNTTITLQTINFTGGGTETYDVSGWITEKGNYTIPAPP